MATLEVVKVVNAAAAAAATKGKELEDTFSGDFGLQSTRRLRFRSILKTDDFGDKTSLLADVTKR